MHVPEDCVAVCLVLTDRRIAQHHLIVVANFALVIDEHEHMTAAGCRSRAVVDDWIVPFAQIVVDRLRVHFLVGVDIDAHASDGLRTNGNQVAVAGVVLRTLSIDVMLTASVVP